MTDQELKELQLKQEIDARFKALESQFAAKVEELAKQLTAREQAIRAEIAPLAARVGALEKQLAGLQAKK